MLPSGRQWQPTVTLATPVLETQQQQQQGRHEGLPRWAGCSYCTVVAAPARGPGGVLVAVGVQRYAVYRPSSSMPTLTVALSEPYALQFVVTAARMDYHDQARRIEVCWWVVSSGAKAPAPR